VFVFLPFFYYPWKHLPFEALTAGPLVGHPLFPKAASACCCCSGIVTNVIATTPNIASTATIAITANVIFFWFIVKLTKEIPFKDFWEQALLLDNFSDYGE
jgi:hypothetical protein